MAQAHGPAAGDVFLLAPLDEEATISKSYLLLVEAETDTRQLLTDLLGDECRTVELEGEDDALLFLRDGLVPCLLLVQLRITPAEAWVLADVIRDYRSFGTTTVQELPGKAPGCLERLAELLEVCAAAHRTN
jgi:hypothetical protein